MQSFGEERGYPLFFLYKNRARVISATVGILSILGSGLFYFWYSRTSSDPTPDSIVGFAYAIVGTSLVVLASILFSLRRRARKRMIGQLHASLDWHVWMGLVGISILFMHSFGNFNPRSGTYALYAMVALVISGVIGRVLDRVLPRQIAVEASKALTMQGDDRLENISQQLQAIVVHNTQELRAFPAATPAAPFAGTPPMPTSATLGMSGGAGRAKTPQLTSSWDLAYISLEETPQEVRQGTQQYRFVPDRRSALAQPGALIPGAQEHLTEMMEVQRAMQREQVYRHIIRYWRLVHILLALLTVGLTVWHLEYALSLLIPTLLPH